MLDRDAALRVVLGIVERQRTGPLDDWAVSKYIVDSIPQCVLPDPRIAAIEALCDEMDAEALKRDCGYVDGIFEATERVRAILRGGPATDTTHEKGEK